ncbi:YY1-associated factor 2 [Ixodes scapularis]|uniref:YY1-associated factor 2 n=1 Tax=Ixodes scapularis TaxID=6945 RepID=UPI001A9CE266|nr:YY1-associated factor 2 [Ixodes scapularis]
MDSKKSPSRRPKRQPKEDNVWDCSVCTYRNTAEAFKCLMCDVRKGTSTRKPRINPQLVAQQLAPSRGGRPGSGCRGGSRPKARPRLKNVDRSTGQQRAVTVNNVTVIITEFQPKRLSDAHSSSSTDGHSDGHGEASLK